MTYSETLSILQQRYPDGTPGGINLEDLAQLKTQNTFETHLDIAKAMATEMRKDMARYDNDTSKKIKTPLLRELTGMKLTCAQSLPILMPALGTSTRPICSPRR